MQRAAEQPHIADLREPYREVSPATSLQPLQPVTVSAQPAISVIGLEQDGVVSVACLAHLGFHVIGVDHRHARVADVLEGNAPVQDGHLDLLLLEGMRENLIEVRQNAVTAVLDSNVTLVSGGVRHDNGPGAVAAPFVTTRDAVRAIGAALAMKSDYHVVVFAGLPPRGGLIEAVCPVLEHTSGKRLGVDFGVCSMPTFGRFPLTARDFYARTRTVVGSSDARAAAAVARIVRLIDANAIYTSIANAEMVKRIDILWEATRAEFDTEIERLCEAADLDGAEVMDIFRAGLRGQPNLGKPNLGQPNLGKPGLGKPGALSQRAGVPPGLDLRAAVGLAGIMGDGGMDRELPLIESLMLGDSGC